MPWLETVPVNERNRFLDEYLSRLYSVTELCERHGVSRKTGYKWINRFEAGGRPGLVDQSRAPHSCPHQTEPAVSELLLAARRSHPSWGPSKLIPYLASRHPEVAWPAPSTVSEILLRNGLVTPRRRRRRHLHPGTVPAVAEEPNEIWPVDFKGHFKTRDGVYVYPLTITDLHSRCLLACEGLLSTELEGARRVFEKAFYEFGLPTAIRSDNGTPFASTAFHGLTRLNVWWMRLGIQHQRIPPSSPQHNGAHERMHRTLKYAVCCPPRANLRAQQRAFDRFRVEFNEERPHQALDNATPASLYRASPREYTGKLPPQEYPGHYVVKRVHAGGCFRLRSALVFIATPLEDHLIGLEEIDDGVWSIYLNEFLLGRINERENIVHP